MALPRQPIMHPKTSLKKRSILVAGHATSISLEEEFWTVLKGIADQRHLSLNQLVADIDSGRNGNLSSALRVFVLGDLLARLEGKG